MGQVEFITLYRQALQDGNIELPPGEVKDLLLADYNNHLLTTVFEPGIDKPEYLEHLNM